MPRKRPSKPDSAGVTLRIHVQPRASRNAIERRNDGTFRVRLTAAPVDNEANRALIEYLSDRIGTPRAALSIITGERSREKTIRVRGLTLDELERRLE